jgi:hypothetical protein
MGSLIGDSIDLSSIDMEKEALKYLMSYKDDLDDTDSGKLSCTITID